LALATLSTGKATMFALLSMTSMSFFTMLLTLVMFVILFTVIFWFFTMFT
jgi:hypothetical protein